MANAYTQSSNTWVIDTVADDVAVFFGANPVYVKSVRWVGGTTAGHTAVLTDAAGEVLLAFLAAAANHVDDVLVEDWWATGFRVPTLGSGKLYVTVG